MSEALFTAVVMLGAIFIFIFLFVLLHKRGHHKKLAKQRVVLADVTWKNKLELGEQETINNHLLAIDNINFILLYINFCNEKEDVRLIDLWQIKSAKVTTEDTSIYEQRSGKSVLVDKKVIKLQLEITLADVTPKVNLVLYQFSNGMQEFVQIKTRAEHWCQLITSAVQELPHPSKQIRKYA
jgi:hypothetical protein